MITLPSIPAHLEVAVVPLDAARQRVAVLVPGGPAPSVVAPGLQPIDAPKDLFTTLARPFPGGAPPPPKGFGWFSRSPKTRNASLVAFVCERPAPDQLLVPVAIDGHDTRPVSIAVYVAAPPAHDFTLTEIGDDRPRPLDHFPDGLGHLRFRSLDPYTTTEDGFVPAGLVVDATYLRKNEPNTSLVLQFIAH